MVGDIMNWDLIGIISLIWCCWIWSGIMAAEFINLIKNSIKEDDENEI